MRDKTVSFLKNTLGRKTGYIPRDDYREIMELSLMLLGEWQLPDGKDITIKIPGAYHMARWIGKVIYSLKIYLFREQFKLTASEEENLKEFCLFASLIYVEKWIFEN